MKTGSGPQEREPYSALNVMTSTEERIVGELGRNHALQAMVWMHGGIPDPTFGYLRGSPPEHRKIYHDLMTDLVERDLDNPVYVGKLGRCESEMSFVCETRDCTCRYHMRYTRDMRREVTIGTP